MSLLSRPWSEKENDPDDIVLSRRDCFLDEGPDRKDVWKRFAPLLHREGRTLKLLPYPVTGGSDAPLQTAGLPMRPKIGAIPRTREEEDARDAYTRMHRVLARIQECEAALDDPENLWDRLRDAWLRAEDEADPRMAEIVRQARDILPSIKGLKKRIRRVLRRQRERTPLDRVQEMDRGAMLWLVRQPGRNMAERAGADQRIMAIVRHENFDTLENRVLHAYLLLAAHYARQWRTEHMSATNSQRFRAVEGFLRFCRQFSRELAALGVRIADPGTVVNYVLMEDHDYRNVYGAWELLLKRNKAEDALWAWQANSWTDFCVLALTLAMHEVDEAKMIAQSPLIWLDEAEMGRRFRHDLPLAVFWLKNSGLIVEVQARPENPSKLQYAALAHIWLRISDLKGEFPERRVPVWTPHCFAQLSPKVEAEAAVGRMAQLQHIQSKEVMQEGLILMPTHRVAEPYEAQAHGCRVNAIALGAVGEPLGAGRRKLAEFVCTCFKGTAA